MCRMVTPMASRHAQTGQITLSWVVVVVTVVAVVIFARLGLWQLGRAQEKISMLDAAANAAELPALTQLENVSNDLLYRHVRLRGKFDFDRQFLRDNIVLDKQPGYEVLTPLLLETRDNRAPQIVLVNRGWLPLGHDRQQRPDVMPAVKSAAVTEVEGILVKPSKGFTLGEAFDDSQTGWPAVMQYLDYKTIAARLDTMALLPAVVVLKAQQPQSYAYSWKPVADGPEKHYGYAFQWFAMLFAVVVLFIYLSFFKKDEPDAA